MESDLEHVSGQSAEAQEIETKYKLHHNRMAGANSQKDLEDFKRIADTIDDYLINKFAGIQVNSIEQLDDLYMSGIVLLPADKYLWNLEHKLRARDYRFTKQELQELEEHLAIIYRSDYPDEIKQAIMDLFIMIIVEPKQREEAIADLYAHMTGESGAADHGPGGLIAKFLDKYGKPKGGKRAKKTRSKPKRKTRRLK